MKTEEMRVLLTQLLQKAESSRRAAAEVETRATHALDTLGNPASETPEVEATGVGKIEDIPPAVAAVNEEAAALTAVPDANLPGTDVISENVPPLPPATPIPRDPAVPVSDTVITAEATAGLQPA